MRVLLANKFFYVHGGCERYLFELSRLLTQNGHSVVPLAMQGPRNYPSPYERYFVSHVDFDARPSLATIANSARAFGRMFYSFEAERKTRALIRDTRPDVMHVRNIYHQLTPSVLVAAKASGVPTVMTVADYNLLCPTYKLLRDGQVCELCVGGRFSHCVRCRCVKGSLAASALAAAAGTFQRLLRLYERNLDLLVCPSEFMRDQMIKGGWDPARVVRLPHYIDVSSMRPEFEPGSYAVCFGRLTEEKGLHTLVAAMGRTPDLNLVVVGEGWLRETLEAQAAELPTRNVRFVGYQSGEALWDLVRGSAFAVVPSEWYEVFGLGILEAFALGKPVVSTRIGAIPELVRDGETGRLVPPADVEGLAGAMREMMASREALRRMGQQARERAVEITSGHLERILAIYELAARRSS